MFVCVRKWQCGVVQYSVVQCSVVYCSMALLLTGIDGTDFMHRSCAQNTSTARRRVDLEIFRHEYECGSKETAGFWLAPAQLRRVPTLYVLHNTIHMAYVVYAYSITQLIRPTAHRA